MSLRDQLLAKGLVSKKQARKSSQQMRKKRKADQGSRRRKKDLQREEEARIRQEAKTREEQRQLERDRHREVRDAHEHSHRVRNIVLSNRLGGRGPVPFHFRRPASPHIHVMQLPVALARDLRVGRAGIAGFEGAEGSWEHHVVTERGVRKLHEVQPEAVLHFVTALDHLGDPAEALSHRSWEAELGPRRVRDRDAFDAACALERARDASRGTCSSSDDA